MIDQDERGPIWLSLIVTGATIVVDSGDRRSTSWVGATVSKDGV